MYLLHLYLFAHIKSFVLRNIYVSEYIQKNITNIKLSKLLTLKLSFLVPAEKVGILSHIHYNFRGVQNTVQVKSAS